MAASLAALEIGLKDAPRHGWASLHVMGLFAMTIVIGYDGYILGLVGADAGGGIALIASHQPLDVPGMTAFAIEDFAPTPAEADA